MIVCDQPLNNLIDMDYFYNGVMNFLKLDIFVRKDFQGQKSQASLKIS